RLNLRRGKNFAVKRFVIAAALAVLPDVECFKKLNGDGGRGLKKSGECKSIEPGGILCAE
ncbi:MAG TPA: hypothetical protein VK400_10030, partial [Pyrinomonadaceae bacterium]|nr:hypothetical protein [Pyrinomonadaceae bacterium]